MPILLEQFIGQLWDGAPGMFLEGSGASRPSGLEALLEYNGLVMNDRLVADQFRIGEIDGLQDADVRDSREANPSDHGESAFNAYYGGRTITLNGRVQAGNVGKLRDMQQALRYAFQDLTELPLYFRTGNINTDVFIMCRKSAPTASREAQTTRDTFRRDFLVTLRASDPRFMSVVERSSSFAFGAVEDFSAGVAGWTTLGGTAPTASGGAMVVPTALQTSTFGIGYDPRDSRQTMKVTTGPTITANDYVAHVASVIDVSNLVFARAIFTSPTAAQLSVHKVDAGTSAQLAVAGANVAVAANTAYWMRTSKNGNVVTAEFWTTDPALGGAPAQTLSHTLAGADATKYGAGITGDIGVRTSVAVAGYLIDDYRVEPLSLNHQVLTVRNAGSFFARPRIHLHGPMTDPEVVFEVRLPGESAFRSMRVNGSIPAGRYYEYDVARNTLRDDIGANKFNQLDVASKDLLLPNGDTPITVQAASTSGTTPKISVFYRDTWI